MTREKIKKCLMETLKELQPDMDEEKITEKTCPIKDMGMDSLDGIECAVFLSERLRINIPDSFNPIVKDEDNGSHRPMYIGEIIDKLKDMVDGETTDVKTDG